MSTLVNIRTRPLMPGFGAEILGVDLATADEETLKGVVDTFHRHGAIMLRDQKMSPGQLVDFISNFGEPEDHTLKEFTVPGHPKVYTLSNRVVDGKPIGAHNDGVGWHTDYSYKAEPVMATMLYAVEVPPEGSDTLVADCVAAWNALPPEKQAELDGKILHHSYQYFMSTREYGARELSDELKAQNPDVYHPLVRTHPADGRKALWPSTGTVIEVMGMPKQEGLDLVEEMVEFATQDRFVYRHKWRKGDIMMWDNRCTLHTGTLYDDTKYIREMHRLWVRGDKPY
ncbi:TauD/TfdA family dioxygenase [Phenylobacterium sp.]|uniref:TauD/TfdA dioxygenase family protein n=1 Tax=Phenylobacterium sp. TaxID=1871053 RepID=UPI0025FD1505|nr:TauD/TfdA family dioxygenase [Phenylobacterium sp.]